MALTKAANRLISGAPLHVEDYGAVNDASADATQQAANVVAFQAALDAQGEIVCSSNATYVLNDNIRMRSHTWLHGGSKTIIKWTHNGVGIDTRIQSDPDSIITADNIENIKITDLVLQGANNGNSAQVVGNHAVQLGYNTDSQDSDLWGVNEITNVTFYNWGDIGLYIHGQVYSLNVNNSRFDTLYDAILIDDNVAGVTGVNIHRNMFGTVGNNILTATNDDKTVFGPGNVTSASVSGYLTEMTGSNEFSMFDNRTEVFTSAPDYYNMWNNVKNANYRGTVNVYLDGASVSNDVIILADESSPGGHASGTWVFEDTAAGSKYNRIRIHSDDAASNIWKTSYGSTDNTGRVVSDVQVYGLNPNSEEIVDKVTAATETLSNAGTYLADTTSNNIVITLPRSYHIPGRFIQIMKMSTDANTVEIKAQAVAPDGGYISGYDHSTNGIVLSKRGDFVRLVPVPNYQVKVSPYQWLYTQNWELISMRVSGSFTAANNTDTTITNRATRADSVVTLMPTNDAAGTLQGSSKHLVVSARTLGASFVVSTADGVAAAGTETFEYLIQ